MDKKTYFDFLKISSILKGQVSSHLATSKIANVLYLKFEP